MSFLSVQPTNTVKYQLIYPRVTISLHMSTTYEPFKETMTITSDPPNISIDRAITIFFQQWRKHHNDTASEIIYNGKSI